MVTLRDYQAKAVADIRSAYVKKFRAPLFVLPTGGGKCLGKGTEVLMYDGSIKLVEEIETGELIMGPDSNPRKVLSLARGVEQMFKITLRNGDSFTCNGSHILSLVCNSEHSSKYKKNSVHNLTVYEYLKLPSSVKHILKAYKVGADFEGMPVSIDPYILGVWLGDGDSKDFTITTMDKEIVDYLYDFSEKNQLSVYEMPNGETKAKRYRIKQVKQSWYGGMKGFLSKHNLINNKHIPSVYLKNSREIRLALLAGIIDTDGHLHNNCYEVFVMHKQLAKDITFLCRSLGFSVNIGLKKDVNGYRIGISGDGLEDLPVKIARKKASKRQQIKNALRYAFEVEPLGVGEYYGFEIDGDRLFMLGDFTVTHNTVLFTYIAQNASNRGNKVLILVHRVELLRQTSKTLRGFGVRHGLINPNYTPDYGASVQVASVQTMLNRMEKMPFAPDLIIIDEAHHATASTWRKVVEQYPKARLLGVTATPVRGDGAGLGAEAGGMFDILIEGPSTRALMDMGYLVEPIIYAPKDRLDLSGIRTKMGDYDKKQLSEVMDKPMITGDAVAHYRRLCDKVPAVAFCVSVQHAEHVASEFRNAGYSAYAVDGAMDDEARTRILAGLGNGKVDLVASCDLISEGTDIPAIGCAILLRPTQSTGLYLQQVGRALRPCAGKDRAVILDHVGNVLFHGLPDTQREWSLEGDSRKKKGKKEQSAPRVLQCKKCFAIHEPAPKCPVCGHVEVKQGGRKLETQDGELAQITASQQQVLKMEARKQQGKAQTLEELREIGRQRGYKPSWAEHVYNARKHKQA